MKSDDIILGILLESPSSGYEIKRKFSTIFVNFYNGSFGSIYPILHKLEQQKKVTVELIKQDNKPDKKIYSITENGKKTFLKYLDTQIEPRKIKWDFMIRMYYAEHLDFEERVTLIDSEIKKQQEEIEQLNYLNKLDWTDKMKQFQKFTFEIGIKEKELMIDELTKLKRNLE